MIRYTKLAADGSDLPADHRRGHQAVRVDHDLLARPIIVTAHRSPNRVTWSQAKKWAEDLDINGWSWRLPTVEEAFLIVDRSRAEYPALPPEFFPDCDGEWIWTGTEDAQPPAGYAWSVNLDDGASGRGYQGGRGPVRAVRAGCSQLAGRSCYVAASRDNWTGSITCSQKELIT